MTATQPSSGTASTVEFDPYSSTFFDDPYPVYRRLRDEAPVYRSDRYDFWALSRWDDVVAAHRDWQHFSSRGAFSPDLDRDAPPPGIIGMDPPEHDRMRALVNRVFTPRSVVALEPMVREVIGSFLDRLSGQPRFDAVADFSAPFPIEIISRMLGVPEADRQRIRHWVDLTLHREPGSDETTPQGVEAGLAWGSYVYELVGQKRRRPDDDMLSRLCQIEVERADGEAPTRLDDVEITAFAALLVGAGAETVTKLVASAVVLFARNPHQWRKVLEEPSRLPAAVEEILRYWPPSQYQNRVAAQDTTLHGVTIPVGKRVLLITGAATRDDREFTDPDRFDIERTQSLAIGFGHGIHSCLGAALARMESRIALEEWARRYAQYQIEESALERVHMTNVAGFSRVPVVVEASGATVPPGATVTMPAGIGVIDLMIGFPSATPAGTYDFMRPMLRDRGSAELAFPAGYMFKGVPEALDEGKDPVEVTLGEMDRHGVAIGLVGLGGEAATRALREHPRRFAACLEVNPNNIAKAVGRIRRAFDEHGIKAVSSFPAACNPQVPISDCHYYPVFQTCVDLDIPVILNAGIAGPRLPSACQDVMHFDQVCYDFPDLRVVMRHGAEPWEELAVKLMLKWPGLYYMTSAFAPKYYPRAIIDYANTRGADKVLYAGYFPMGLSLERIFDELPGVPFRDPVWPKFLRDNAVRVFKLDV